MESKMVSIMMKIKAAVIRFLQSAALMTIASYHSVLIIYKHGADLLGILSVLSTFS